MNFFVLNKRKNYYAANLNHNPTSKEVGPTLILLHVYTSIVNRISALYDSTSGRFAPIGDIPSLA
jgi:hypothetical protein